MDPEYQPHPRQEALVKPQHVPRRRGRLALVGLLASLAQIAEGRAASNIVGWGGQCPPPPDGLTNAVCVAGGAYHAVALRADGTVTAWNDLLPGQTNRPPGLTNVVAVGAGFHDSFAVRDDGTV